MAETKEQFIKQVKTKTIALGEFLNTDSFSEAYEVALELSQLFKSEDMKDFTGRELEESGLSAIQEELKKYWYFNKQMRSAQGALRKKGDKFLDYVG